MINWDFQTQLFRAIAWRTCDSKTEAELMAEVIAERTNFVSYNEMMNDTPGRISDLEINQEKIYER